MPTDKKAVEQIGSMTTTFKEMLSAYDAQNAAKLNQATDKVDNAAKALEALEPVARQEDRDFNKKIDAAVQQLNDAAKNV